MSDFCLIVGEKELKVHKIILGARSPYFKAMFSSENEENRKNLVEITDFELEVIEALLKFLYTGKIPEMNEEFVRDLLRATDYFQVEQLKSKCEDFLIGKLSVANAADTILLADSCNSTKLKNKALEFVKK